MINFQSNPVRFQNTNSEDYSKVLSMIDDYDKQMLGYLIELHNSVKGDVLNVDKFSNVVEALQHMNAENEYDYLNALLHPERCKGVKIPSPIPVPSCAFQLHNTVTLSTNTLGNLVVLFNPFFLYNDTLNGAEYAYNDQGATHTVNFGSSFYYNNSSALDGRTPISGGWTVANLGQGIPNVYNQYRLVSASVVVRYIGRMDITSGVIGGAIVYDESILPSLSAGIDVIGTPSSSLQKYANFDLAMDSFYHQETNCIKGLREIYFPLDNTYEEYSKMIGSVNEMTNKPYGAYTFYPTFSGLSKSGFQQMIYVLGAPSNTSCFKVDVYCNFETLPNAAFLNYMPVNLSQYNVSPEIKKQSIAIVQRNPITTLDTQHKWYGNVKRKIFDGIKKIWKSGIPSKLLQGISPYILPYLRPAVSLMNLYSSGSFDQNQSFAKQNPNVAVMAENAERDDANQNDINMIE